MPTTFDNVLLDPLFSNIAKGGPQFATGIVRSGEGGAIDHRNKNWQDYIGKYSINYGALDEDKQRDLRQFAVLRAGMARAFRFLPPDGADQFEGVLGMVSNGEIEQIESTDGSAKRFFFLHNYEDDGNTYDRWITHPSPVEDITITISGASTPHIPIESITIPGTYDSANIFEAAEGALGSFGNFVVYYNLGCIVFDTAIPAGKIIQASGQSHLPVCLESDVLEFSKDPDANFSLPLTLTEVLPASINLKHDTLLPMVVLNFAVTGEPGGVKITWDAATHTSGIDEYIIQIDPPNSI